MKRTLIWCLVALAVLAAVGLAGTFSYARANNMSIREVWEFKKDWVGEKSPEARDAMEEGERQVAIPK